ncbi:MULTISPECIES: FecR family protein [unclassified Arcicella]|uniref:FecR family protein n=1 Tax=unclassified Arcicella TaxID=2644986 RepID=UPI0028644085|nr:MULTISPECIES: FecR family protein [unclassified Arcicella]MDR6564256.1 ferric-dicitrate binding protein FerR (iron transport regulator) [Arcicella sp. BE51]MDR6811497.1 ferric-dicitrate binding protein FerR (iron transport regulator) [Arcicella sp. BE140]MDR6823023.1 ferric-dicitrate binding protein FerR (iron transport regulator) [Arcicella sp. BE139]
MNYSEFDTIDFVKDDFFCRWVQNPDQHTNEFWQDFLQENPEKKAMIMEAKSMIKTLASIQNTSIDEDASVAKIWQGVESEMEVSETPNNWGRYLWQLAASVTLLIGLGWWMNYQKEADKIFDIPQLSARNDGAEFVEKENTADQPMHVMMTDGSEIVLEKNARIRYPKVFEADKREVFLVGEAFFEVTKNPKRPFLIYTKKLITRVLGTSFTIKANPETEEERVVVKTGRVSVVSQLESKTVEKGVHFSEANGIVVTPNQEAIYLSSNAKLMKKIVTTPTILTTALQKQVFIYKNASLAKVFVDLEKAYGIKIIYDENLFEECTINGNLSDETMFDKLNSIAKITGIDYQVVDAQIIVSGKGCE